MPTVNFFIGGKKRLVPIYVRMSAGRGTDLIVKSGYHVAPKNWSSKTQTLKQRADLSDNDKKLIAGLKELKNYIEDVIPTQTTGFTKEWLSGVVYRFHNNRDEHTTTLNEFIEQYITKIENGEIQKQDGSGLNVSSGFAKGLRGFQKIFEEYQGRYSEKRLKQLAKENKKPRPEINLDFNDIDVDFNDAFKRFLIDEKYKVNTIGRFVKQMKYFMTIAKTKGLHKNQEFKQKAFSGMSEESFQIALTTDEIEKIYNYKTNDEKTKIARDMFVVMSETCLRVSDYPKISASIKTVRGVRMVSLYQEKTKNRVLIPLTQAMEEILNRPEYNGNLPYIHPNTVNKLIKHICYEVGMTETETWEETIFGKRVTKTAQRWEKVSCHSGRRSGATALYKAGVKLSIIMSLTGHRTETQLMDYIKLKPEELALEAAESDYYKNNHLRAV